MAWRLQYGRKTLVRRSSRLFCVGAFVFVAPDAPRLKKNVFERRAVDGARKRNGNDQVTRSILTAERRDISAGMGEECGVVNIVKGQPPDAVERQGLVKPFRASLHPKCRDDRHLRHGVRVGHGLRHDIGSIGKGLVRRE